MNCFFDTSADIKYFISESGTLDVIDIIENEENTVLVSALTMVEFTSGIYWRHRMGDLTLIEVNQVLEVFNHITQSVHVVEIENAHLDGAVTLLKSQSVRQGLKTLDAIQLATFDITN